MRFSVESVCVSSRRGIQKHAVESIRMIENFGIEHDAHAGHWHRQVSFLAGEAVDSMKDEIPSLKSGDFGENIVTRGIDWTSAEVGGNITIGDVELEITQKGKECHTHCAIYQTAGRCIMPELSVFAKVIKGGIVHAGSCGYYSL